MVSIELEARLRDFLARQCDGTDVQIIALKPMAGGASREIWSLDLQYRDAEGEHRIPLVLRRDSPGVAVQTRCRDEFQLLRAASATGVPVPEARWLADEEETLDGPFFLMNRLSGETLPRRLLRDEEFARARRRLPQQLGAALAAIHRIDHRLHRLDFLAAPEGSESPAEFELGRYEQIYRLITPDPHPAFELALRWLRQHRPPIQQRGVVHGDFRIGNVLFDGNGLVGILDWELAHIGDPMEDLGWICVRSWRFGNDDLPVGGIGTREEFFDAYEKAGGSSVDPQQVRYWEVLGNLKWGIMTIMQAKAYLEGQSKSVELASLGRRTAEMELELLNLMTESA